MSEATPRVLASHLQHFQHQTVRLLGKVTQLRGDTAVLDAGGQVTIMLNRDSHLTLNHAAEIIGKVDNNLNVKVLLSTDFGTGIDFDAANSVVEATHKYKEIFYDDQ